uniref:Ribosomal protein mS38 C-terminal domain-containing protein n=1 Tax=Anopheles triannulatus TaxID=58253 RepID=A0A2M4ASZ9_9DIPT
MFHHRQIQGLASLARSFSRIALVERSASLPIVATTSRLPLPVFSEPETNRSSVHRRIAELQAATLRSPTTSLEIGYRPDPLLPLKEIIDIPLVSRIIENPVSRPTTGSGTVIGDNLSIIPTLDLPTGTVPQGDNGKQAARLIVIRRRKMRKHKLKKLRKRMKFEWLKVRQRRELKKEKLFQAELLAQIKEAEKFSAEAYVADKLRRSTEVPIPRFWKGKRLPQFLIKQKLGIE